MQSISENADNGVLEENTRIRDEIISLVHERGIEKSICPSEVARAINGDDEKAWRLLMKPIRAQAVTMAQAEEISILRKGKTVDPTNFKGVYRLSLPRSRSAPGKPTSNGDDSTEIG